MARVGHGDGHDYGSNGSNALNRWARGTESAGEHQNGIGGAGKEDGHRML
jgi:hypothetical protein